VWLGLGLGLVINFSRDWGLGLGLGHNFVEWLGLGLGLAIEFVEWLGLGLGLAINFTEWLGLGLGLAINFSRDWGLGLGLAIEDLYPSLVRERSPIEECSVNLLWLKLKYNRVVVCCMITTQYLILDINAWLVWPQSCKPLTG